MTNRYSLMPALRRPHAGKAHDAVQTQVVYIPLKLPLDSARHTPRTARGYNFSFYMPDER
jgi:hypothetical protein